MADIDYPDTIPNFKLGKRRSQVQTYRTSQPFAGPLFIEKITDESPVTWDVSIACRTRGEARAFQAFLRTIKGGRPFNKDILIEDGNAVPHEVRFIEEPLTPNQVSDNVWIYSGVIYAVALIQPDALINDDLIILHVGEADFIDIAVNNFWPEA